MSKEDDSRVYACRDDDGLASFWRNRARAYRDPRRPKPPPPPPLVLGIDPGYRTGLAVVQGQKCIYAHTVTNRPPEAAVLAAITATVHHHGVTRVVVQTPMFAGRRTPLWNKSAMAVTKNALLAKGIVDYCRMKLKRRVQEVPPRPRSGMKMPAKMFKQAFGYTGSTSEHARDAANLAMAWVEDERAVT